MSERIVCRKCIACGQIKDRGEMIRISRDKDGKMSFSASSILPGRGAYICRDMKCVKTAKQKNSLNRSFRTQIDAGILDEIEKELA